MIAQELEVSLHMAFMEARQKRHEFITVEHLLLAMLDNPTAADVLRACAVDIDDLRSNLDGAVAVGMVPVFLDVTDPEPLPTDHPLWSLPNCIITPHVGNTPAMAVPFRRHW